MIRRRLGPLRRHGRYVVATLDETVISGHAGRTRVSGYATKSPMAVLISGPSGGTAHGMDGSTLTGADIEALSPGAWIAFTRQADS